MAAYYLDSSALVKRYIGEPGSSWITNLTDPALGHDLYTVRLTGPEIIAALFRKVRVGEIPVVAARQAAGIFRADWQQRYQISEVDIPMAEQAMGLIEQYGLRGYDAVHLASVLRLHLLRQAQQYPPIIFVSADVEQLRVATAIGFATENPNLH